MQPANDHTRSSVAIMTTVRNQQKAHWHRWYVMDLVQPVDDLMLFGMTSLNALWRSRSLSVWLALQRQMNCERAQLLPQSRALC